MNSTVTKSIGKTYLAITSLMLVVASMSNPDYYAGGLVSLLFLLGAALCLSRGNKKLVLGAYAVLATYSFWIGRCFFSGDVLGEHGRWLVLATIPVIGLVGVRVFVVEERTV